MRMRRSRERSAGLKVKTLHYKEEFYYEQHARSKNWSSSSQP